MIQSRASTRVLVGSKVFFEAVISRLCSAAAWQTCTLSTALPQTRNNRSSLIPQTYTTVPGPKLLEKLQLFDSPNPKLNPNVSSARILCFVVSSLSLVPTTESSHIPTRKTASYKLSPPLADEEHCSSHLFTRWNWSESELLHYNQPQMTCRGIAIRHARKEKQYQVQMCEIAFIHLIRFRSCPVLAYSEAER